MWYNVAYGIIIVLIFISLIILFVVMFYKLHFHKISEYRRLIFEKELEYQKKLNQSILEAQEQIFANLSQDLHDDLGQQLTVINFQIEKLKLDVPQCEHKLFNLSDSVKNVAQSVRNMSYSLHNGTVFKSSLYHAIDNEIKRLSKNNFFKIELQLNDTQKEFELQEKIILYRIFQEILNNIIKHAHAKHVNIAIQTQPAFEMKITDDGVGFNWLEKIASQHSLGLQNIISRAKIIGYYVRVNSEPNQGTQVIIYQ